MERRIPEVTRPRGVTVVACGAALVATSLALVRGGDVATGFAATLLFVGADRPRNGFATLVGWLIGGSLIGAAGGYAAVTLAALPLSTQGAVGLGLALGGGLGTVSNLLAADDGVEAGADPDSVTVDMDTDDSPTPTPADLFDGHPDPVLYVVDEGHGPVVLAANRAYADTFDVPADAISGTPLGEVLLVNGDPADVVDAVEAGDSLDAVYECQTPDGETEFRVRTTGTDGEGYVIYTPTDAVP